ncbi:TetR/AcrR family transcriptional regulator, partial [Bacteroides caccae]|uniref:helix-turn-helix domain-containing protein n=1 Tax=Bacteroides caccae TaxID=47678 RepID=UPI001D07D3CC
EAAHWMFLERGYDAVTVAEIAQAAGVSSVTVFKHFARKEDLFLDRRDDAVELLRAAVRDRASGIDALTALHGLA